MTSERKALAFEQLPELIQNLVERIESLEKTVREKHQPLPLEGELMSVEGLCKLLGKSRSAVYRTVRYRDIPYIRQGNKHYDAVAEKKRIEAEETLQRVLDYTMQTMVIYMSEEELNRLCGYITEYSLGDTPREVSPVKVDSALKSIDLMHFGWNIGKAFGKRRIHTATFIKRVFAHALRDIEVSTIERKMSHTESECRIKLDGKIG